MCECNFGVRVRVRVRACTCAKQVHAYDVCTVSIEQRQHHTVYIQNWEGGGFKKEKKEKEKENGI